MSYDSGKDGTENAGQSAYQKYGIAVLPGGLGYHQYVKNRNAGKGVGESASIAVGVEFLRALSFVIPIPGPWVIVTAAVVAIDNEPTEPLEDITEKTERTLPPQSFRT
jgi:hypothetical protein